MKRSSNMSKFFTAIFVLLVTSALSVGILSGCSQTENKQDQTQSTTSEQKEEKKDEILLAPQALHQAIPMLPAMAPIIFLMDSALITACIQIFKLLLRLIKTAFGLLSFALRVQQTSLI